MSRQSSQRAALIRSPCSPRTRLRSRRRLLRSQGFALVSIPYWEWDGLGDHEGFRGRPSEETWTKRAEVVTQKLIELEAELRERRAEEKSK